MALVSNKKVIVFQVVKGDEDVNTRLRAALKENGYKIIEYMKPFNVAASELSADNEDDEQEVLQSIIRVTADDDRRAGSLAKRLSAMRARNIAVFDVHPADLSNIKHKLRCHVVHVLNDAEPITTNIIPEGVVDKTYIIGKDETENASTLKELLKSLPKHFKPPKVQKARNPRAPKKQKTSAEASNTEESST